MKIIHQYRDKKVEKEIHSQIGMFMSNKKGGVLLFDSRKDKTQFYISLEGKSINVLNDIRTDGKIKGITHSIHSLTINRDSSIDVFVPYYMDALIIKSDSHIALALEGFDHDTTDESAITLKRMIGENQVSMVIQGADLQCDLKKNKGNTVMNISCKRLALAVDLDPKKALVTTSHLLAHEEQIRQMQDEYHSATADFFDPEIALAYSIVLNSLDSIFTSSPKPGARPIRTFVDVNNPYTSIALHSLLLEGEYKRAKNELLREFNSELADFLHHTTSFEKVSWPLLILGRMLNKLCTQEKLMQYFSIPEIKQIKKDVEIMLTHEEGNSSHLKLHEPCQRLACSAMKLSIYELSNALTSSENIQEKESELRRGTKILVDTILHEKKLSKDSISTLMLTSYIYPQLLTDEGWKGILDRILHETHGDFRTMRNKLIAHGDSTPAKPYKTNLLDIEIHAISNLAAITMHRVDPERYENQVNKILRMNVADTLYKGYIGRPSSAYDQTADPQRTAVITNTHLLNSALFLEMLRTIRD